MNSLNQIIIEGNVVRQPEQRELPSGKHVCTLPIAVNHRYKTPEGGNTDEVSFIDIEAFGPMAETCSKWCPKGRGVRVVGRLKQDRWKDAEGKAHSKIKVIAEHIEFKALQKTMDKENLEAMAQASAAIPEQEVNEITF